MRFIELIYGDKKITDQNKIEAVLEKNNFHWLIDSEIEDALIEISKNTLVWHGGNFYSGFWNYGIFKNGNFYGTFENSPKTSEIIPYFWLPQWCGDIKEPSARVLTVYNSNQIFLVELNHHK
jgi:hypothetical protein